MSGSGATTIAETSNGPSVPNSTLLPPPFDPMIAASPELAAAYQQRASLCTDASDSSPPSACLQFPLPPHA